MRSTQITLRILEVLSRLQPAGVSEITRELDLPKSTVQRSLKALAASGWIETVTGERGAWSLSLTALIVGGRGDFATRHLRMAALPVMEELRRTTKESIFLAARHGDQLALIERLDGINPMIHAWPRCWGGSMHSTSLGKAILAHLPQAELEAYLDKPLEMATEFTVTDSQCLKLELDRIRKDGFATTFETNWINENAVGAAIRDSRGQVMGAISLAGPADRLTTTDCIAFAPLIIDAARRIGMGLSQG